LARGIEKKSFYSGIQDLLLQIIESVHIGFDQPLI
jgi:hypothetical protein